MCHFQANCCLVFSGKIQMWSKSLKKLRLLKKIYLYNLLLSGIHHLGRKCYTTLHCYALTSRAGWWSNLDFDIEVISILRWVTGMKNYNFHCFQSHLMKFVAYKNSIGKTSVVTSYSNFRNSKNWWTQIYLTNGG